ncbi:hypothetical protein [Geofilum rubicundum]|uniref:hypothetical protein n=1 Tax=Geofilum rubicundum TaxID=472113 RepID=UPI000781C4A7|nr:hypothetical protein [Geofilum rubicundum]
MGLKSKTVKLLAIVLLACGFPNKSVTASALELIERKNDLMDGWNCSSMGRAASGQGQKADDLHNPLSRNFK